MARLCCVTWFSGLYCKCAHLQVVFDLFSLKTRTFHSARCARYFVLPRLVHRFLFNIALRKVQRLRVNTALQMQADFGFLRFLIDSDFYVFEQKSLN